MNIIEKLLNNYDVILENNQNHFIQPAINIPVYVINLEKDKYRRAYIKYIMKKMKINYTLVIVKSCTEEMRDLLDKKTKVGIAGCFLSHLWCINHAIKKKNGDYFLIFEDDVIFHKNFGYFFKKIDYTKYDLLQLGCCDFNLKNNMKNKLKLQKNTLNVYNPVEQALGAYGNIYNINFAKILLYEKINFFREFDSFDMYYQKYNIGICYPNLVTAELSTTNLGHDYSLFRNSKTLNFNNYFINKCFYDFKYNDYYFIWIIFIEHCCEYCETTKKLFDVNSYYQNIHNFSIKCNNNMKDIIVNVLTNNNIYFSDINNMLELIKNDEIKKEKELTNEEPINHESPNEYTNEEPINEKSTNDHTNEEPINQESTNKESINQKLTNEKQIDEPANEESLIKSLTGEPY